MKRIFDDFRVGLLLTEHFIQNFKQVFPNIILEQEERMKIMVTNKTQILEVLKATLKEPFPDENVAIAESAFKLSEIVTGNMREYHNLVYKMMLTYMVALTDSFMTDAIKTIFLYSKRRC